MVNVAGLKCNESVMESIINGIMQLLHLLTSSEGQSDSAVLNVEFGRTLTALCHLLLSLHITTACVDCCLDTAQPQPQELEIVNKKEELYLQARVGRLPMASL